jgi:hypothetical protein
VRFLAGLSLSLELPKFGVFNEGVVGVQPGDEKTVHTFAESLLEKIFFEEP